MHQPITAELTAALKRLRYAFFVLGRPKDLREAFEGTKELMAKAEATQAAPRTSQAPSQIQPGQTENADFPPVWSEDWRTYDFDQQVDYQIQIRSEQRDRIVAAVILDDHNEPDAVENETIDLVLRAPAMANTLDRIANGEFAANIGHAEQVLALRALAGEVIKGIRAPKPEPVEMPPKTDLPCGCTHAGIMAGCPVHNAPAPSPFNVNPEGNPQL